MPKQSSPSAPAVPAERPCQGPQCSGGSLPPLAPLTIITITVEQWGCMNMAAALPDLEEVITHLEEGVPHLTRRASSVYHPPRAI